MGRCHQAMQEMALVMQNSTASPSGVLDTSCFTSKSDDDNSIPGTSPQVDNNNNQACTPASKRARVEEAPMS